MNKWGRRLVISGAIFFAVCAGAVAYVYVKAGQFRGIENAGQVTCRAIGGVVGAEDIAIDPAHKRAFVSVDDRRATMAGRAVRGRIALLDLTAEPPVAVEVSPAQPETLHPHGISLWTDPASGEQTLFVVNHLDSGISRVELFTVGADGKLAHKGGIIGAELLSPNDIVGVGPNRFYATNDHGSTTGLGRLAEDYLQLPRADIVYFDGTRFRRVAEGLQYANGINVSADGKRLYATETTGFDVVAYARDPDSGGLSLLGRTSLPNGPDNIDMGADGSLWIAGHPHLLDFVEHAGDPAKPSPSEVLRLIPAADGTLAIETVLTDKGEMLSGSSVAADAGGGRFLVGSVFEEKILDCRRR
ncbi:SMP-30/gluconolactonase/LRE family protein [Zavarzinia sp.]|uniref:SMP-30/gluconolactonase/LRE family protein n=1 Tax=Zavarzinia sp. TaxID=2027920 RepID=UPI00356760A3